MTAYINVWLYCGLHWANILQFLMIYLKKKTSIFIYTLMVSDLVATDVLWNASELLTHLPLVPHICVSKLGSIGSDNGLSPIQRQAII